MILKTDFHSKQLNKDHRVEASLELEDNQVIDSVQEEV